MYILMCILAFMSKYLIIHNINKFSPEFQVTVNVKYWHVVFMNLI